MDAWVEQTATLALLLAMGLVFVRMVRGPTVTDRVVALDLFSTLTVALLGVLTLVLEEPAYLDAALTLSLVTFLATIAFARYVERAGGGEGEGR